MKESSHDDSDPTLELTTSMLIPIKYARDFDKNVTLITEMEYRLGGRQKIRKLEEYTV